MESGKKENLPTLHIGVGGALVTLSPLPFMLAFFGSETTVPPYWRLGLALLSAIASILCSYTLFRNQKLSRITGNIAALGTFGTALPFLVSNPFAALIGTIAMIAIISGLADFRPVNFKPKYFLRPEAWLYRAWWSALMIPLIVIISKTGYGTVSFVSPYIIEISLVLSQILFIIWIVKSKKNRYFPLPILCFVFLGLIHALSAVQYISNLAFLAGLVIVIILPRQGRIIHPRDYWWDIFLSHPVRILFSSFFTLCVIGSFLLLIPPASARGVIDFVDAAFTSVSAVCVTGLIVLDTPNDFTQLGQFFILLLIQLGGLGIMSITTVAFHVMGRRISLRHERVLTTMTETSHKDLVASLVTILKMTFFAELIGTVVLTPLFYESGDSLASALWRGTFTAISAFCNAGFSLQTESLLFYGDNAGILLTVSSLIILGGLAPATSLLLPRWVRGRKTPIPARIAFIMTLVLLVSGTLFMLAFEWDGVLAGLPFGDKILNAWFQSATLRTAGFNSVNIAHVAHPTFIVMLCFMFIGGSPGGTAGGVKTTTAGILILTFWSNITRCEDVVMQNRKIGSVTIYRAITIVISGLFLWIMVVLMLELTQQIPVRDIIFETTSAIGTVGLSTGATAMLDEIGKIIIMVTMFVGRIGPTALYLLISEKASSKLSHWPETKITLT